MEHKVYMNYIHPSSLLRQLSDLWKADQMCDAVLTVDKIIVAKAHKVVLLAVSPKLKSDSSNSSQSPILDVCLPSGLSHRAVHAFLQCIYEGYLILTKKLAKDLLKISSFLKIKCLSNCCSDFLDSFEDDVVVVLDDEPSEVKTEEFCHVRKSKAEELAEEQTERGVEETNPSASKKRRTNLDISHQSAQSPVPSSPSHSASFRNPNTETIRRSSDSSGSRSADNSVDRQQSQFIVQDAQSGETVMSKDGVSWDKQQVKVKREQAGSCAVSQENSEWNIKAAGSSGDPLSSVSQGGLSLEVIKTEPEDGIDQNFFQSITSTPDGDQGDYDGQTMWFSGDSVQQCGPSEGMVVSNMGHGSFQQRTMTPFSSLSQMRAQQSIKRSIQSSVSAARRARSMAGASASVSSAEEQGEQSFSSEGREEISNEGIYYGTQNQFCLQCGGTYKSRKSFLEHVRSIHRTHQYNCDVCGKTFPTKFKLVTHKNTHLSEKPFACKLCSRVYCAKASVINHIKSTHGMNVNALINEEQWLVQSLPKPASDGPLSKMTSHLEGQWSA